MGFRFRRSIKILPGVRWNISKKGSSFSFGGRGLTYNVSKRGTRTTVGIPGTGISYSTSSKSKASGGSRDSKPEAGSGCGLFLIIVIGMAAVFGMLSVLSQHSPSSDLADALPSPTPAPAADIPSITAVHTSSATKSTSAIKRTFTPDTSSIPLPAGIIEITGDEARALSIKRKITELSQSPGLLPSETILLSGTALPIIEDGQQTGVTSVLPGTLVKVISITGNKVKVLYQGNVFIVTLSDTDLLSRVAP